MIRKINTNIIEEVNHVELSEMIHAKSELPFCIQYSLKQLGDVDMKEKEIGNLVMQYVEFFTSIPHSIEEFQNLWKELDTKSLEYGLDISNIKEKARKEVEQSQPVLTPKGKKLCFSKALVYLPHLQQHQKEICKTCPYHQSAERLKNQLANYKEYIYSVLGYLRVYGSLPGMYQMSKEENEDFISNVFVNEIFYTDEREIDFLVFPIYKYIYNYFLSNSYSHTFSFDEMIKRFMEYGDNIVVRKQQFERLNDFQKQSIIHVFEHIENYKFIQSEALFQILNELYQPFKYKYGDRKKIFDETSNVILPWVDLMDNRVRFIPSIDDLNFIDLLRFMEQSNKENMISIQISQYQYKDRKTKFCLCYVEESKIFFAFFLESEVFQEVIRYIRKENNFFVTMEPYHLLVAINHLSAEDIKIKKLYTLIDQIPLIKYQSLEQFELYVRELFQMPFQIHSILDMLIFYPRLCRFYGLENCQTNPVDFTLGYQFYALGSNSPAFSISYNGNENYKKEVDFYQKNISLESLFYNFYFLEKRENTGYMFVEFKGVEPNRWKEFLLDFLKQAWELDFAWKKDFLIHQFEEQGLVFLVHETRQHLLEEKILTILYHMTRYENVSLKSKFIAISEYVKNRKNK